MTRILYRIAAVLILVLDIGHSSGYPWSDPAWGVDLRTIQSSHFTIFGFSRTYWDFYVGFGMSISVYLLLAAVLTWQLGTVATQRLGFVRTMAWTLTCCFAAITLLSYKYFFSIPIALSSVTTALLAAAAWRSGREAT